MVIEKIKPSKKEMRRFKLIVSSFIKKLKLKNAKAELGGSGAKDTWLTGNHDADIFVAYTTKQTGKQLSDSLGRTLKQVFPKVNRVHGSRDYFQLTYKGLSFEVIPIIKISKAEKALNITDISPLHSKWVNKYGKGKKDEIRLAKHFCRANNLYGAESFIGGFSGYALEILTIQYGSFEKLLKASQKWKNGDIVDFSKFYKKKMALFHLNKSKLQSPLIVIDPVDKDRNAAAALTKDKFFAFKKLARKYLKSKDVKLFEKKVITLDKLKKSKGNVVFMEVSPLKGKEDVIGSKLLKVFNHLSCKLDKFDVKKSGWDWDRGSKVKMYFILGKRELDKFEERIGPPLKMKDYVKAFKRKNKDTFVKSGRVMARIKVKNRKLKDFVNSLLEDEYVVERTKKVKVEVD